MEEVKLFSKESNGVGVINDPFSSIKNIDRIRMNYVRRKSMFTDNEVTWIDGSVHFVNGKTEGEQKFEASNLTELFEKIRDFCLSFEE